MQAIDLLFADGDEDLRDLYGKYFTRHGWRIETAANGLECLEKLRCMEPHSAIIDLGLLWGGGDGVLAVLRDDHTLQRIPVVIATGDDSPSELSDQTRLCEACCFSKPYSLYAILDRIAVVVGRLPGMPETPASPPKKGRQVAEKLLRTF